MAQPFVVSLKLMGDASSAVAATEAEERALDSLHQTATRGMETTRSLGFSTANVAAQFQDIGVTTFAGQSPLQIALQQGTQLSAILGAQGAAGAANLLKTALFSVLSPVSLLTIGVVALTAYGIQWLMSLTNEAEPAEDALERHSDWLDEILIGYKSARQAAKEATEEALKLPQVAAVSELGARQDAALQRFKRQLGEIAAIQGTLRGDLENLRLAPELFAETIAINEQLVALGLTVDSTDAEFDALVDHLTLIKNDKAVPEQYRTIAGRLLEVANSARAARAEIAGLTAAARDFSEVQFRGLGVDDALAQIKKLTPELRTVREQIDVIFAGNIGEARSTSEISALVAAHEQAIAALDAKDAQTAAAKAARDAAREDKRVSDYERSIGAIRERTAMLEVENNVIGLSAFAAEKLRIQMELEIAARKDAIGLTPARIAEIDKEAAAQARLAATIEETTALYNFGKSTLNSFFSDLKRGLGDGTAGWDDLGNAAANALDRIADRALGMAADGLWDLIFGAFTGALGGGVTGGTMGNGLWGSAIFNAKGNAFSGPGLGAYSNTIVDRPTLFPFAKGIGLMGEAGGDGEAIMPLGRNARGQLGVQVANSTQAAGGGTIVQIIDQRSGGSIRREESTGPNGQKIIRAIIRDEVREASRRGALGF